MVCCKNNLCCKESSLSWWKNNFWKAADDRPLISAKNQTFQNENGMPYQKDSQFPTDLVLVCFGCGFWPILSRKATTMRPFGALLQFQFCHYCLILDTACKVHDFLSALLEASKDLSRMCKAFIYNYTYNSYAYSFIHIYTYLYCLHKYSLYIHIIYILYTLPLHLLPTSPPGRVFCARSAWGPKAVAWLAEHQAPVAAPTAQEPMRLQRNWWAPRAARAVPFLTLGQLKFLKANCIPSST